MFHILGLKVLNVYCRDLRGKVMNNMETFPLLRIISLCVSGSEPLEGSEPCFDCSNLGFDAGGIAIRKRVSPFSIIFSKSEIPTGTCG